MADGAISDAPGGVVRDRTARRVTGGMSMRERPWWTRLFEGIFEPTFVPVRIAEERRCPECSAHYEVRDRYCPGCRQAVPEWRFG
jgi:hypothetical protein